MTLPTLSPCRRYPLLGPASRAEPRDNRHDSESKPSPYVTLGTGRTLLTLGAYIEPPLCTAGYPF